MGRLFSYVVKYDSGFAPNPFYGLCTLATCKPDIRRAAQIGDWIVGTGSADQKVRRGTRLVHAMKVADSMNFQEYWDNNRFHNKKPMRSGSRKQSCGDNIYFQDEDGCWNQLDSFHTNPDGSLKAEHVNRDTGVDRILISNDFYYFGGEGPIIPAQFRDPNHYDICRKVRRRKRLEDEEWIAEFVGWLQSFGEPGYYGRPMDWILEDA